MSVQDALQKIGEVEKSVLEYNPGAPDAEGLAAALVNITQLSDEYGRLYHYVAEQCASIKELVRKLSAARVNKRHNVEELKKQILRECVALRRYVSRIKT